MRQMAAAFVDRACISCARRCAGLLMVPFLSLLIAALSLSMQLLARCAAYWNMSATLT
eukprot:CAMPEP_0173397964 /NCGR_PEP_ID=MMETSP1356-20130122/40069_1 /TAXON_ID=77927 ORGANISM="Hemiselmis virescens, Strain PCC157" /NCGR_SAMPLE_ID=MMETSP1356 /ASSEMBLY_ACC=CAM_ASM_000847 /LENGTH=57 /DNA_ID=CAMNT_0014357347 /DNA_START=11 /DNA_END=184 /DNA_ORIENTATION=-